MLEPGDVVEYVASQQKYEYLNGNVGVVTGPARVEEYRIYYPVTWITNYRVKDAYGPFGPVWHEPLLQKIGHIELDAA